MNKYSDDNLDSLSKAFTILMMKDLSDDSFMMTMDLFGLDQMEMMDLPDGSMESLWSYIDRTTKLAQWVTFNVEAMSKAEEEMALGGNFMVWATAIDELVCPYCAPLDGLIVSTDDVLSMGYPPAHVNCRCELLTIEERYGGPVPINYYYTFDSYDTWGGKFPLVPEQNSVEDFALSVIPTIMKQLAKGGVGSGVRGHTTAKPEKDVTRYHLGSLGETGVAGETAGWIKRGDERIPLVTTEGGGLEERPGTAEAVALNQGLSAYKAQAAKGRIESQDIPKTREFGNTGKVMTEARAREAAFNDSASGWLHSSDSTEAARMKVLVAYKTGRDPADAHVYLNHNLDEKNYLYADQTTLARQLESGSARGNEKWTALGFQEMQDRSQKAVRDAYPEGQQTITVYRGIQLQPHFDPEGKPIPEGEYWVPPMASWTENQQIAHDFANKPRGGAVIAYEVPIEDVAYYHGVGGSESGLYDAEKEVAVIHRTPTIKARVVRYYGKWDSGYQSGPAVEPAK